jgi:hypothetical protein
MAERFLSPRAGRSDVRSAYVKQENLMGSARLSEDDLRDAFGKLSQLNGQKAVPSSPIQIPSEDWGPLTDILNQKLDEK